MFSFFDVCFFVYHITYFVGHGFLTIETCIVCTVKCPTCSVYGQLLAWTIQFISCLMCNQQFQERYAYFEWMETRKKKHTHTQIPYHNGGKKHGVNLNNDIDCIFHSWQESRREMDGVKKKCNVNVWNYKISVFQRIIKISTSNILLAKKSVDVLPPVTHTISSVKLCGVCVCVAHNNVMYFVCNKNASSHKRLHYQGYKLTASCDTLNKKSTHKKSHRTTMTTHTQITHDRNREKKHAVIEQVDLFGGREKKKIFLCTKVVNAKMPNEYVTMMQRSAY